MVADRRDPPRSDPFSWRDPYYLRNPEQREPDQKKERERLNVVDAKWVPYDKVNEHLYDGWQLVTGYKPCHHDKYGILMVKV